MKFDGDTKAFSKFLKIEPGQSVSGVFRGEPLFYACKEVDKKTVPCPPSDPQAKARFKVNFIMKQKDLSYKSFVWEQSGGVYNALKTLNEDFPLETTIVKISREGSGLKTKYTILPNGSNFKVSPELDTLLNDVQLIKLDVGTPDEDAQAFPPEEATENNEDLPF